MSKLKVIILIALISLSTTAYSQDLHIEKTWESALKVAQKESKDILLVITASSWCKPCIKMKKNVFSDKDFIEYVNSNLVLYLVDLGDQPINMNSDNYRHYREMQKKYNARQLPSLVLVNAHEEKIRNLKGRVTSLKNVLSQLKNKN